MLGLKVIHVRERDPCRKPMNIRNVHSSLDISRSVNNVRNPTTQILGTSDLSPVLVIQWVLSALAYHGTYHLNISTLSIIKCG